MGEGLSGLRLRWNIEGLRLLKPLLVVAILAYAPAIAKACAGCMNENPLWQRKVPILLGFIGFPFLVFGAVLWAIRRHVGSARGPQE
jgi:hypothetical protein